MSDCSTRQIEPQKTCGTCFYSTPRKYGHWTTNDLICLRHAVSTHSERHHVTECGWGIDGPRGGRPKEPDTVDQRCQQLEQVARDMYAALHVNEHCSLEFIADNGDCEAFRARLEALGVSVNG